jgi:Ca2+/Na+ antiporter
MMLRYDILDMSVGSIFGARYVYVAIMLGIAVTGRAGYCAAQH